MEQMLSASLCLQSHWHQSSFEVQGQLPFLMLTTKVSAGYTFVIVLKGTLQTSTAVLCISQAYC